MSSSFTTSNTLGKANITSVFFVGWGESLAITAVTLFVKRQNELGTASGIAGAIRFLIASVSSTIYTVVLNNEISNKVGPRVAAAVEEAGLPSPSIAAFIQAFAIGPTAFDQIPGISPSILSAGTRAYQEANTSAYSTVFLTTIAFTVICMLCGLLMPEVDALLTTQVATTLGREHETVTKEAA